MFVWVGGYCVQTDANYKWFKSKIYAANKLYRNNPGRESDSDMEAMGNVERVKERFKALLSLSFLLCVVSWHFVPPLWEQLEGFSNHLTIWGLRADDCYKLPPTAKLLTFDSSAAQTRQGLARAEETVSKDNMAVKNSIGNIL